MIYKSYEIEKNLENVNSKMLLFYGENLGLKNDFKKNIKNIYSKSEIIFFNQEEIIKNENLLFNEIRNDSLFQEKKIFFIEQAGEKILKILEEIDPFIENNKIYLFADVLDRKSKLRNYFEKSKKNAAIACYQDNEITLKKIINSELKGFDGLTPFNINLILDNISMNRARLHNEIDKIKIFFDKKKIEKEELEKLLNIKVNDSFNALSDQALIGNKKNTNKLLSDTVIDTEKVNLYLNIINQRLDKLYDVNKDGKENLEKSINDIKPPIFWKDKPNFILQAKKWQLKKILKLRDKTYKLETELKSNSQTNKNILLKKLMVDICEMANS